MIAKAFINGNWITLNNNDTIDNKPINVETLKSYSSPVFVELKHKKKIYCINVLFIQLMPEYKPEFSNRRIL